MGVEARAARRTFRALLADRRRTLVTVSISGGLAFVLLIGAVQLGLHVPGLGALFAFGNEPRLDYSAPRIEGLSPLDPRFIRDVLGNVVRAPAAAGTTAADPVAPPAASPQPVVAPPPASPPVTKGPDIDVHPLTNDDFRSARDVRSLPYTATTDTRRASRERGEPSGCAPAGGTAWYRFVSARNVGLIADTFGSDHPVSLGVFRGTKLRNLQRVGCSTDPRGNARVAFPARKRATYYFQVSSVSGGDLIFSLRMQGLTTEFPAQPDDPTQGTAPWAGPSPDGRYVAFGGFIRQEGQPSSRCVGAVVYVPVAPNSVCRAQTFLYDRETRRVTMVSVNSDGEAANDATLGGGMSADGRYVAMASWATNLVRDDTNSCPRVNWYPGSCGDVFVHDRDADGNGVFDETFADARKTVRVSVGSNGEQGNMTSWAPRLSADGRYVTFQSWADNLVKDDTNGVGDVFVHDRDADANGVFDETFRGARRTWRVSVSSSGEQTETDSLRAADPEALVGRRDHIPIERGNFVHGNSQDGRYVMFRSPATNLDPRCTNGAVHMYVHDIVEGSTVCVSLSSRGIQGNKGSRQHNSGGPKISDDGRFAIFNSDATNLVRGDTNGEEDLFVRDMVRGTTRRITVAWDGSQARGEGVAAGRDLMFGLFLTTASVAVFDDIYTTSELNHAMTPDGRYVFFSSGAHNLVPGDDNEARDIFVRDLRRGTTTMVSVSTTGAQGNASSNAPAPTADGRLVVFYSLADNLDESSEGSNLGFSPRIFMRFLPQGP